MRCLERRYNDGCAYSDENENTDRKKFISMDKTKEMSEPTEKDISYQNEGR